MTARNFLYREVQLTEDTWKGYGLPDAKKYRAFEVKGVEQEGVYLLFLHPRTMGFGDEIRIYCTDQEGKLKEVEKTTGKEAFDFVAVSKYWLPVKEYCGWSAYLPKEKGQACTVILMEE